MTIILEDNGLPWYAAGLEGKEIKVFGIHFFPHNVKRYVTTLNIPDSNYKMWFEEHHVKEVKE